MYKHLIGAFALCLVLPLCGAIYHAPCAGVCFSALEFERVEKMQARCKGYKAKINEYKRHVAALKAGAVLARARIDRIREESRIKLLTAPRGRSCVAPWIVVGVTAGACAAGIIAIGATR